MNESVFFIYMFTKVVDILSGDKNIQPIVSTAFGSVTCDRVTMQDLLMC